MTKNIAIIGAGYTGLSAATQLSLNGFDVAVFETASKAGGLAKGYKSMITIGQLSFFIIIGFIMKKQF